jgi:membrane protein required for colicin V production
MNLLDLIIIATMVFLVIRGVFRGFFKEVGSLAGVILGIWLANLYHPHMTAYLKEYLPFTALLPFISFAAIFALVLVSCNVAGWGLKMLVKKAFLGWADKSLGAGFAVLKGIILTYLVIVLLTFLVPSRTPLIAESKLAPLIISSYQSMVSIISPGSYQEWKRKILAHTKGFGAVVPEKARQSKVKDGAS